ncbi:ABC transporter ATP-binding protein [uncultured Ruegeria sp.]|uniref:ABC transporter ATP-binding protein n=1 Tax=uncultured Ruegeria sp. TaxID=259304 RepID=UPI002608E1F5|nr:ABC transporter ATP-binding protein [uncultured Ruegeria sp.]
MSLLELKGLEAGYGYSQILFGVDLKLERGEAATLMGRNGMGKTTTVRSIMGLLKPQAGEIRFDGHPITGLAAYKVGRAGVGLVPEGRRIFPTLTVEENLRAFARSRGNWTLRKVYDFFPRLEERKVNLGSQLSGGEQQMLAIGRALMTNPSLLILDEATEGLAPLIRKEIWEKLAALKAEGLAILLIDKDIAAMSKFVDHHTLLNKGEVVWSGTTEALTNDMEVVNSYMHL